MGAVIQYMNQNGKSFERSWCNRNNLKFNALVKCFVQYQGEHKIHIIEKPSTRQATFYECCRFAEKIKSEYGDNLKQLIIWNLDELKSKSNWF